MGDVRREYKQLDSNDDANKKAADAASSSNGHSQSSQTKKPGFFSRFSLSGLCGSKKALDHDEERKASLIPPNSSNGSRP